MIKFFRKRHRLLTAKNKIKKHLKHGIEKITPVLICVLITSTLNDWSRARENNLIKSQFIEECNFELKAAKENIETKISFAVSRTCKDNYHLKIIKKEELIIPLVDLLRHSGKQEVLSKQKNVNTASLNYFMPLVYYPNLWILGILILFVLLFVTKKYELHSIKAKIESKKLQELHDIKTQFYTNITHQFRNPLTVILGMAGEVKKNPDEASKLIERNSKQILLLINQMLAISKMESGKMVLDIVTRDVIPYVRYLTESYASYAASKNIQLIFFTSEKELVIDYDDEKLQQIISNLISNALKFTPKTGKITISLNVCKKGISEKLIIRVKDNGIGIPASKIEHIFDRFYRVEHTAKVKEIGTGIGLALVKELIRLMKGEILVKSELKKGTEFTVVLPINRGTVKNTTPILIYEEALLKPKKAKSIKVEINKTKKKSISKKNEDTPLLLIIEDNLDVASYIETCTDKYRIEKAINGQAGIDKAIELVPDIIISDVMMPEKDGYEVCEILKSNVLTSHIPIILLTAREDIDSKLEGLEVGADAYLSKPFVKEELLIRLKKLLELRLTLQYQIEKKHYATNSIQDDASNKIVEPTLNDLFLKKIYDLVHANLDNPDFGNSELSNKMLLSESQLYRKIKAITNKSPAIYIRSLRLLQAKELLLNTNMTIAEIAYNTGFNEPSYFSRSFSKEFDTSPSNFRK